MDATACREQMQKLLAEERVALGQLAMLLDREHEHLKVNDTESLQSTIRERQQCVGRVLRVDEARRALCRACGQPDDVKGLEQLLRWCDPQGVLAREWAHCAAAAADCRGRNDRNGALVGARLKHVQARLGALFASRRETVTYGPGGGYSLGTTGGVLTAEV
jgi:flagellar biosynthesis protein FlgN